ncbi:MAG: hypothetical protein Q9163_005734 [Psora crenata]
MLKKYLLGPDAQPTAGDGLGILFAQPLHKDPRTSSQSRQGSPISQVTGPPSSSEAAFQKSLQVLRDPPNGTRAPRCSRATDIAPLPPTPLSPPPDAISPVSPRVAVPPGTEQEKPKKKQKRRENTPWQDMEIPEELGLIDDDIPEEIRNIVHDTMELHRAMRLSRLHSDVDDKAVADALEAMSVEESYGGTEISITASARSPQSSPLSRDAGRKRRGFYSSQESVTTVGSENGSISLFQLPKAAKCQSASPKHVNESKQDLVETHGPRSAMEARFQECKDRTSRSRGLYNLLKGRRIKSMITPETLTPKLPPCECISCFDDVPQEEAVDGLPCKHRYCRPCFKKLVDTAILNEDTFPPKCCVTEIPKTVMRKYLASVELINFDEKALEYAVPLASRYYCVALECARWIDTRIAKRTNGALEHITCKCRAEFCYTCGAIWRTCECTEADQRQREGELDAARVRREAEARAEEEEVRRAIAAVEEAERLLHEEREVEEAMERERVEREAEELARCEFDRIGRIGERFAELRAILDYVGLQQKHAIEKRHFAQEEANEALVKDFEKIIALREKEMCTKKEAEITENSKAIKALQKKHAAAMMETIQRHRRDQDELLTKHLPEGNAGHDAEVTKATMLEALLPLQELERTTLKGQQSREIAKWKKRGERAVSAMDTSVEVQQMRLEEEEKMRSAIDATHRQEEADLKWFDLVHAERANTLAEDESRLIHNGGDVVGSRQDAGCTLNPR